MEGFISHRLRPTYYSPSSRTALAEAELTYKDQHQSRSVYVALPVHSPSKALETASGAIPAQRIKLAIWTTTPWSLPGNAGVMVNEAMSYCLVRHGDDLLVVAEERLDHLKEIIGCDLPKVADLEGMCTRGTCALTVKGSDLLDTKYTAPFPAPQADPFRVLAGSHVTSESGTGLVHSAPAHGHEDYDAFAHAKLLPSRLHSPIDDEGKFTSETGEDALTGLSVLGSGTDEVVRLLQERGFLLAERRVEHRYPCDWKTKQPIIVR